MAAQPLYTSDAQCVASVQVIYRAAGLLGTRPAISHGHSTVSRSLARERNVYLYRIAYVHQCLLAPAGSSHRRGCDSPARGRLVVPLDTTTCAGSSACISGRVCATMDCIAPTHMHFHLSTHFICSANEYSEIASLEGWWILCRIKPISSHCAVRCYSWLNHINVP